VLQPERHQEQFEAYHRMEKRDGNTKGRIIVIGLHERHDWTTLHEISEWMDANGNYEIFSAIAVDHLDHYDMTTRPAKGDAMDAIRKYKDVTCVIALHVFGIDIDCTKENDGRYCYTRENHKLLDLCMDRGIPLIVWGDQPRVPATVRRTEVGTSSMYSPSVKLHGGAVGLVYPITMYEKDC
jgi:hypothetical protein